MTVPTECSPGTEIEIRGERVERRRRWAVLLGLAGFSCALLLGVWFFVFVSQVRYRLPAEFSRVIAGVRSEFFWPGWWTLTALAMIAAVAAIAFGIGGLSKLHRESRSLAVVGIFLGAVTIGMVGCLGWKLIVVLRMIASIQSSYRL